MFSRGHSDAVAVKVAKIDRWDIWVAQLSFEVSISQLNAHIQDSAIQSNKFTPGLDKTPRPSISNVIRIFSSDTICQLNKLFPNSEAAMLLEMIRACEKKQNSHGKKKIFVSYWENFKV